MHEYFNPINFSILFGSNMFTKFVHLCSRRVHTLDWSKLGSKTQKTWKLLLITLCYSETSEEFMVRLLGTKWKGRTPQPSTKPITLPCAWVNLVNSPYVAHGAFHSLSIPWPLNSQMCSVATFTLKPSFQKKSRNIWIIPLSLHTWRPKQNKTCLKGRKLWASWNKLQDDTKHVYIFHCKCKSIRVSFTTL